MGFLCSPQGGVRDKGSLERALLVCAAEETPERFGQQRYMSLGCSWEGARRKLRL